MVVASRTVVQGVLGSVNIGKAPDVEAAANKWSANIDALEANAKGNAMLRSQLKAGEATQRTLRRAWAAGKKQVTSSVDTFCEGSADLVHSFALDVITQGGAAGSDPWPSNLAAAPGHKPGEVAATWSRPLVHGRHFVVQWATDPANPVTASPNIAYTKIRFVLPGQTSGAMIHFRVAYQGSSLPEGALRTDTLSRLAIHVVRARNDQVSEHALRELLAPCSEPPSPWPFQPEMRRRAVGHL